MTLMLAVQPRRGEVQHLASLLRAKHTRSPDVVLDAIGPASRLRARPPIEAREEVLGLGRAVQLESRRREIKRSAPRSRRRVAREVLSGVSHTARDLVPAGI